jgi:phospholipase C
VVNGVDYMENTKFSFNDFLNDAKNGELPDYSFIEPKFFGQHNDQHPSAENEPTRDGTVLLGEKLIWDVYNAVKNSPQKDETLLIINHDEHGGCFIKKNTIVNEVHDHTSFIKTMSEKWNFEGLTDRDKNAKSFASIFSAQKRDDYPEIPEPVIQDVGDTQYGNDDLNGLQKSILKAIHEIAKQKPKGENLGDVDKIGTVEEAIKHIEKLKTII